jgi:hypothetical protein
MPSKLEELLAEQEPSGPEPRRIPAKVVLGAAIALLVVAFAAGQFVLGVEAIVVAGLVALAWTAVQVLGPELLDWYWNAAGAALSGLARPGRNLRTALVLLAAIVIVPVLGLIALITRESVSRPSDTLTPLVGPGLGAVADLVVGAAHLLEDDDALDPGPPTGEDKAP